MADTKVTIHGDSTSAVAALEDAAKAVDGLSDDLTGLDKATDSVSGSGNKAVASLGKVTAAARNSGKQVSTTASGMSSLAGALRQVSPAAGKAASALGSMGSGLGSLTTLVTPMGAAMAAAGVAISIVSKELAKQKEATEAAALSIKQMQQAAVDATTALRELGRQGVPTAQNLREHYAGLAREGGAAATAIQQTAEQARNYARVNLANDIAAAERESTRLGESMQVLSDALISTSRTSPEFARVQASFNVVAARVGEVNANLQELRDTEFIVDTVTRELSESTDVLAESFANAAAAAPDFAGIADSLLRASADAGDFAGVLDRIGSSGVGAALVDQLSQLSDEFLSANGASREQLALLEAQRQAQLGGLAFAKEQDAAHRDLLASLHAEGEAIAKANEARAQAAVQQQAEDEAARAGQTAWYEYESQTYQRRLAYEQELTEAATARFEQGLILSQDERARLEELWEAERTHAMDMAQLIADSQQMLADSFQDVGVGSLLDGMGQVADAFGAAAVAGANMGDALGQSSKKAIASIAKQFGALYLSLGASMLFVPGQQAQGAGLIAAAVALMAIGGAVGAAGKKPQKDNGGDGSGSGGAATIVVDTFTRESPGARARDEGDAEENGDRYGINRGRDWA